MDAERAQEIAVAQGLEWAEVEEWLFSDQTLTFTVWPRNNKGEHFRDGKGRPMKHRTAVTVK
jgi:hypothetical protein